MRVQGPQAALPEDADCHLDEWRPPRAARKSVGKALGSRYSVCCSGLSTHGRMLPPETGWRILNPNLLKYPGYTHRQAYHT
jgi:hypothetical protein